MVKGLATTKTLSRLLTFSHRPRKWLRRFHCLYPLTVSSEAEVHACDVSSLVQVCHHFPSAKTNAELV